MSTFIRARYRPANTRADLARDAPGSKNESMQEFLLSQQVQDVAMDAARDIMDAATFLALEHTRTGKYAQAFEVQVGPTVIIDGNPRRSARVSNDDVAAAPMEFGNSRVGAGHHILARAGQPWHTEKRF